MNNKIIIKEKFETNQEHGLSEYSIFFNKEKVYSIKHDSNEVDNDCYNILMLLEKVYIAGKNNIEIDFKIE